MLRGIFGFCLGAAIRVCDHDFELYDDLSWFYLSEKYFGEEEGQQDVTLQERTEELLRIYNDIVSHCNALSMEIERDDSGAVVYSGGLDSKGNAVDMAGKAIGAMQNLGKAMPSWMVIIRDRRLCFLGFYVSDVYVRVLFPVFHGSKL